MSIVIWRTHGDNGETVWAPTLLCDECGERIDRASDALCIWDEAEAQPPGNAAELHFVHRGSCDYHSLGNGTAEIDELLSVLKQNLDGAT